MKRFAVIALLLSLLTLLLVACDPPVTSGYVYAKQYYPEYSSYTPGYTTESCVHSGKYGEDCYPVYHPSVVIYHPAEYYLELTTCSTLQTDGQCKTGWVYVDEYTYDHTRKGSYYGG